MGCNGIYNVLGFSQVKTVRGRGGGGGGGRAGEGLGNSYVYPKLSCHAKCDVPGEPPTSHQTNGPL